MAGRKGVPQSPEHRAKIGAANRGKLRPAELRARIAATLTGRSGPPCQPDKRAKISAALKEKGIMPPHPRWSAETRAKLSAARTGTSLSAAHCAKLVLAHTGKTATAETRAKMSVAHTGRRHSELSKSKMRGVQRQLWEAGAKTVRISYRYTTLAQALHAHLASTGLVLEPEVRFGRFTVDLYDREHHIAYEADGAYWHDRNERENPGSGAKRDAYLIQFYGLKVVHFTDNEIASLTGSKKKAVGD